MDLDGDFVGAKHQRAENDREDEQAPAGAQSVGADEDAAKKRRPGRSCGIESAFGCERLQSIRVQGSPRAARISYANQRWIVSRKRRGPAYGIKSRMRILNEMVRPVCVRDSVVSSNWRRRFIPDSP